MQAHNRMDPLKLTNLYIYVSYIISRNNHYEMSLRDVCYCFLCVFPFVANEMLKKFAFVIPSAIKTAKIDFLIPSLSKLYFVSGV